MGETDKQAESEGRTSLESESSQRSFEEAFVGVHSATLQSDSRQLDYAETQIRSLCISLLQQEDVPSKWLPQVMDVTR